MTIPALKDGDWVVRTDKGEILRFDHDSDIPESLRGQPIRGKIVGKDKSGYRVILEWDMMDGSNSVDTYLPSEIKKIDYFGPKLANVLSRKLEIAARHSLDRGHPSLFKRIASLSNLLLARSDRTDTDKMLEESLSKERSDEDFDEDDDDFDEDDDFDDSESDDTDVEAYFPMSALPQKERRKGPHPKDVKPGRPDWWNPR